MVQQMSQTPQPHLVSSLVSHFGSFDAAHGWAVNLVVVICAGGHRSRLPERAARGSRAGAIAG